MLVVMLMIVDRRGSSLPAPTASRVYDISTHVIIHFAIYLSSRRLKSASFRFLELGSKDVEPEAHESNKIDA